MKEESLMWIFEERVALTPAPLFSTSAQRSTTIRLAPLERSKAIPSFADCVGNANVSKISEDLIVKSVELLTLMPALTLFAVTVQDSIRLGALDDIDIALTGPG